MRYLSRALSVLGVVLLMLAAQIALDRLPPRPPADTEVIGLGTAVPRAGGVPVTEPARAGTPPPVRPDEVSRDSAVAGEPEDLPQPRWPAAGAAATRRPQVVGRPPTRLVMPAIGVDAKVVSVSPALELAAGEVYAEWPVAAYAAGYHNTSALPGTRGNTVLSGHNDILGAVFRNLIDLVEGDAVWLYAGDQAYHYSVAAKYLVEEDGLALDQRLRNGVWIGRTDDVRLTLVTCWPQRWPTHRLIVIAFPAP